MEKQIREVQQYFKDKILSKDFEIKKLDEYTLDLVIDGQFEFCIWVANFANIPYRVKNYESRISFMDMEFTDEESVRLSVILANDIRDHIKTNVIAKKEKELEDLKKSLQNETN